jgi:hypothetical protein
MLRADASIPLADIVDLGPNGRSLDITLWTRQPVVTRLRPPYPGAQLVDGEFLPNGNVSLIAAIPDRQPGLSPAFTQEAWVLDPTPGRGSAMNASTVGTRAAAVAVSPGAGRVATLRDSLRAGLPASGGAAPALASRLDSVWVGASAERSSFGSLVFQAQPRS